MNYKKQIVEILKTIIDPELNVDIYNLGLIYAIDITQNNVVNILLTFTTPMCPFSDVILEQIETGVRSLDWCQDIQVEITFDPPWNKTMMSEEALVNAGLI